MKIAIFVLLVSLVGAWEDTCTQFKDIYSSGTELCEVMWSDSFEVVDDSIAENPPGYTMWFFDMENNPNEDVTRALHGNDTAENLDQCHLQYFHKEAPSPEGENMLECHPWKNNACCSSETVQSPDKMNKAYGPGSEWDRCGPMSEACERFFVMEVCFYECEPAAGLYRKYDDSQEGSDGFNTWQIHKMPMKKSFCDSWYTACYNDYFCGNGDFFECTANYEEKQEDEDKNVGLIAGVTVAGLFALFGVLFAFFLIKNEKAGKPIFAPPKEDAVHT